MISKITNLLRRFQNYQRINIVLSRGLAGLISRRVDEKKPASWEFSCFSQNGEDGIINILCSKVKNPNRYFIEIGASDGIENNTLSNWYNNRPDNVPSEWIKENLDTLIIKQVFFPNQVESIPVHLRIYGPVG